jgi:hypothetical protein
MESKHQTSPIMQKPNVKLSFSSHKDTSFPGIAQGQFGVTYVNVVF